MGRSKWARHAVVAGSLLAVGLAGACAAGIASGTSSDHGVAPWTGAGIDPATVAYLTVRGMPPLACGGPAPIDVLAADPGAETAATPQASGLRYEMANWVQEFPSFLPKAGWVLMSEQGSEVTFGHRRGALGIGYVLGLKRRPDGTYRFAHSAGGCAPFGYADGSRAHSPSFYVDKGGHLEIEHTGGDCETGPAAVQVHETTTRVDVLVVDAPRRPGVCGGVGVPGTLAVALKAPLGDREVRDVSVMPATPLPDQAELELRSATDGANAQEADRLCAAAATRRHQGVSGRSVTDVATVRRYVPATSESWGGIPGDAVAADCVLSNPGDSRVSYVVTTAGAPLFARTTDSRR